MHALRAERVDAERRSNRGVDTSGDSDDHVCEPVLADVVRETQLERLAHLLELGLERDDRARDRPVVHGAFTEIDDLGLRRRLPGPVELAAADVAKAPPERERRVDVDDEEVLVEAGRPSEYLSGVVEHDRVPVEHQLVLAADEVAEREERARVSGARHEHLLALFGLADVEGRRRQVDEELSAGEREIGCGRPRLPDVLADRRPDQSVAEAQEKEVATLGEVAVLVEDAVVREELLPVEAAYLAPRTDGACIREIPVEPWCADEHHALPRRARDLLDDVVCSPYEAGPEEEIFGRVARHGQLREQHEVRVLRLRVGQEREDLVTVPLEVADHGIQLCECEPHVVGSFSLIV